MPSSPWNQAVIDLLIERSQVGMALMALPDVIVAMNPAFSAMTGINPEDSGSHLADLPIRQVPAKVKIALGSALNNGEATSFKGVPMQSTSDGMRRLIDIESIPVEGTEGGAATMVIRLTDVTEGVGEHSRARLFYESFLTSSHPIEVTDKNGVLVDVNPAFVKIYGYSRAECIGRRPNLVRSKNTPVQVYAEMWKDIKDPKKGFWSGEMLNRDRMGKERPVFLTITAIRDEQGEITHYVGVAVDLREQKMLQKQVAHAEKLASIGQLAAGVAHEINTPLASIVLMADSIRRKSEDPWARKRAEEIANQVDVAGNIVRGLLDFARPSDPKIVDLDLSKVVKDAIEFIRGKQSADVELTESYPPGQVPIRGDRGQIIQVITNVVNNAYDAIDGPGSIRIEVRERQWIAEVEVSDSGPGIPPEHLLRIFDPFFTTKPEGEGTGLGLAICHGIMEAHRGSIEARNNPTKGASFILKFPLRDGATIPADD